MEIELVFILAADGHIVAVFRGVPDGLPRQTD